MSTRQNNGHKLGKTTAIAFRLLRQAIKVFHKHTLFEVIFDDQLITVLQNAIVKADSFYNATHRFLDVSQHPGEYEDFPAVVAVWADDSDEVGVLDFLDVHAVVADGSASPSRRQLQRIEIIVGIKASLELQDPPIIRDFPLKKSPNFLLDFRVGGLEMERQIPGTIRVGDHQQ
jgi:hypothetical protein